MTSPNFSVICVQSGFPSIPEHPRYQKGISYIDIHFSVFLSFRFDTKKANRLSDAYNQLFTRRIAFDSFKRKGA